MGLSCVSVHVYHVTTVLSTEEHLSKWVHLHFSVSALLFYLGISMHIYMTACKSAKIPLEILFACALVYWLASVC